MKSERQNMQIAIGTTNKRKINSTLKIFQQLISNKKIQITSFPARSKVSETPWNAETRIGALNRAKEVSQKFFNHDYYIGLESGLVERYGDVYEEVWACIMTKEKKEYFGYSSGLKVPEFILLKMKTYKKEHWEIMSILDEEENRANNDDTWGTYSSNLITRDIGLEEALRNAIVQISAPQESYYHKKKN